MNSLLLLFLLPILGAIGIAFGMPARRGAQVAAGLQLALTLFLAGCYLFDSLDAPGDWLYTNSIPVLSFGVDAAGEPAGIALALGINGLSMVLLLLTALVTAAAVWTDADGPGAKARQLGTLLISAGAAGAFCSTDLFFFFAFHELALIPTFLLIATQGRDLRQPGDRRRTAWITTLYLGLGSLVLLAGIVATVALLTPVNQPWNFSFPALNQARAESASAGQNLPALLLILGFGTLVSLFPLHSWAARAYASAPPPTAMMHAGVLKKFGVYGLLQFALPLLPEGMKHWAQLLLLLLLGNVLIIGLVTVASKRLDTLFGNSSVMHMGYLFLAVAALALLPAGAARDAAFAGATILMFAHGLSIALAFGLAGSIERRTGTLEIAALGGLARRLPDLTLLFGLAIFAGIGLPGLANFAGEFPIFLAGFGGLRDQALQLDRLSSLGATLFVDPLLRTTLLSILGVLISAIYALRAFRRSFHEGSARLTGPGERLDAAEWVPAAALAFLLLLIGFCPQLLLQFIQP